MMLEGTRPLLRVEFIYKRKEKSFILKVSNQTIRFCIVLKVRLHIVLRFGIIDNIAKAKFDINTLRYKHKIKIRQHSKTFFHAH